MSLSAATLKPQMRDALAAYLIAVADDELIIGHRHSEWSQCVKDPNRSFVRFQNSWQTAIRLRCFVQIPAAQNDSAVV